MKRVESVRFKDYRLPNGTCTKGGRGSSVLNTQPVKLHNCASLEGFVTITLWPSDCVCVFHSLYCPTDPLRDLASVCRQCVVPLWD